ncbi:hypothetical protein RCOM_1081500 [Ricinus communis]|uniref:Uncharacterized protein n=1 Tax=Ricinus communis TaxID=3988 RepID=B9RMK8_RICCO|nr:hypothetical protein RCOM_1081500 [Ricinus communis]
MEVELEFISNELIKPSSPTPNHLRHLRHLQLSFLDQIQIPVWMPLSYFSPKNPTLTTQKMQPIKEISIKDFNLILSFCCSSKLSTLGLSSDANPSDNNKFIPLPLDDGKDFAAFFQITFFKCGGLAISLAMSHKLGDALSKLIFFNCWAAISRGDNDTNILNIPPFVQPPSFHPKPFLGLSFRIGLRKIKLSPRVWLQPVKGIEALAAFTWSRFMAATQANKPDNKHYLVVHAVNLLPRTEPPLSNLYLGNITRIATA